MTELVEVVARAICKASHIAEDCGWTDEDVADFLNDHWDGYLAEAGAAIEAICGSQIYQNAAGCGKTVNYYGKVQPAFVWNRRSPVIPKGPSGDGSHRCPATRQVFEIVLAALNYDGTDIDSLTVGEIRRALP